MLAPSLALVLSAAVGVGPSSGPSGPPRPAGVDPAVHALVVRCVDAYGGPRAVARLARIRELGTVSSDVLHPGAPGRLGRVYARSGRLRVELAYPGAPLEVRVLDGGRGWRFGEEVQGPFLVAMILQAARLDLPALLAAWESKVQDRGAATLGPKAVRVLALEVAPGVTIEAAIDPRSGRILRSRGTAAGRMPLEFVTTYSDFRVVDGVLVAHHEGNWANGRATGETILEQVEFPAALPQEMFQP